MGGLWARLRSLWRSWVGKEELDAAMHEEMLLHLDLEAERLVREQGLDPREARRRAYVAFGGVEKYKAEGRDARGLARGLQWLDSVLLDARLGVRMLIKYRRLTLIGGFAMAVAIAIGATSFEIGSELLDPTLPLADGDRVVALQVVNATLGSPERRVLRELATWRAELTSIEQLGAFRTVQHNLLSPDAPPEPVKVAEMNASGFAVARTQPLAGRHLLPSDEEEGAPPVVVIGRQAWRSHFGDDPGVVRREIDLGGTLHTVVGIMPDGFGFPVDHQFWIPLRARPLESGRRQGPEVQVFGRLAPGVSLEAAQSELTAVEQRSAAARPGPGERLRPVVLPYPREHLDLDDPSLVWILRIAKLLVGALSFVVAVNLAILVYARTVARLGELAIRTAFGASRRRILGQLFLEALALTVIGAAAGLALAHVALDRVQSLLQASGGVIPFWTHFDLSLETVLYALALAVIAAVIMGVVPGRKAMGSRLNVVLQDLGGRATTRLGPVWSLLIAGQIAVAVALLPAAVYLSWQAVRMETEGPGFDAEAFVVATVAYGAEAAAADPSRAGVRLLELMSRLEAEPGVSAVTFSSAVPGFAPSRRIELEDGAPAGSGGAVEPSTLRVGPDLFAEYEAEMLAGRSFTAGDAGAARPVIVNRTFAERFLEDGTALGARFRYAGAPAEEAGAPSRRHEWHEIVGVVRDFPGYSPASGSEGQPTVYHPAAPGEVHPAVVTVRFDGPIPDGVVGRFRQLGAEVDPVLQVRRVVPLSSFYDDVRSFWRHLAWGIGLVTASVLLLSAAGVYALMSYTIARRTREIGVRIALGAPRPRLLLGILGRAFRQLALGLLVGSSLSGAVLALSGVGLGRAGALLLLVAAIMLVVGLIAALGPARRGLRVQPSQALNADA